MKIINYRDIPPIAMDSEIVKRVNGRVLISKKDGAQNFCMRMFEMGKDGYTPRHTHEWEHEVFVHSGKGEVFIKDKWYSVSKGSAIFIPSNIEHQFKNISDSTFVFLCLIPSGAPEL
jgi:quercetin dioxygenase-like cupin family protein